MKIVAVYFQSYRNACFPIFTFLLLGMGALFAEVPVSAPLQDPPTPILLPMQIGDKAALMQLNTMAEGTLIDKTKQEPEMKEMGIGRIQDFAGNAQEVPLVEIPLMKFRNREWVKVSAAVLDFHNFTIITGVPIAGCLGIPEYKDSKLFIDYEAMKFTMHRGDWLLNGEKVQELPLLPESLGPTFKAVIDGTDVTFLIGTAQNNAVSLETSVFDRFVEKGLIKKSEGTSRTLSLSDISRNSKGYFTGGELMGKSLKGLRVSSDASSSIGVGWLAGFRTEIDFPAKKLRFIQVAHMRKTPLPEEMLGAILGYSKGRSAILDLKSGGKGVMEMAGFQKKDEIVSLGDEPYLTFQVVLRMLEKNAGKRIKVTYKRPGVEGIREAEIQLLGLITEWDKEQETEATAQKPEKK